MSAPCGNCIHIENKASDGTCAMGNRQPWSSECSYFIPKGCLGVTDEKADREDGSEASECVEMRAALRLIPGMTLNGSSCGGDKPLLFWLKVPSVKTLYVVGRAIDPRYGGPHPEWKCSVSSGDDIGGDFLGFVLESPCSGIRAYKNALVIAGNIREFMGDPRLVERAFKKMPA